MGTALAVHDAPESTALQPTAARAIKLLRPIAEPSDIIAAQNATRELVTQALQKGRDYGEIPGVDKPSLLKPGAERVILGFGCYARFTIVESEIDHDREVKYVKTKWTEKDQPSNWREIKAAGLGRNKRFGGKGKEKERWVWQEKEEEAGVSIGLYRYVVRCDIVDRSTDAVVGSCVGACSTLESKYIDRPRDCENTALKMSEKRALVGAALITFGLSDQFTQDVEDLPQFGGGHAEPSAEAEPEAEITRESCITWGKSKGTAIMDLETDYLKWACEDGRKFGPETAKWQTAMRAELEHRLNDTAAEADRRAEDELERAAVEEEGSLL